MEATAAALQKFQMHGQDIPWLLAHWAETDRITRY